MVTNRVYDSLYFVDQYCTSKMARPLDGHVFQNGVDGEVNQFYQIELNSCSRGDMYAYGIFHMCCPCEFLIYLSNLNNNFSNNKLYASCKTAHIVLIHERDFREDNIALSLKFSANQERLKIIA